eukprot:7529742-Alexandrium_andersonii.AAC.1
MDARVVLLTTAEITSQRNEASVKGFLKGWYLKEEKRQSNEQERKVTLEWLWSRLGFEPKEQSLKMKNSAKFTDT